MTAPYTQRFTINGLDITSVVIDQSEFDAFVDELQGVFNVATDERLTAEQAAAIKHMQHLPMMVRGRKTQVFFERWGVQSDRLAVMVRGAGPAVAMGLVQRYHRRIAESN